MAADHGYSYAGDGEYDAEGKYICGPNDEEAGMRRWSIDDRRCARWWMSNLRKDTYLGKAVYFAGIHNGHEGVYLCESTPTATALSAYNAVPANQRANGGMPYPEYMQFHVLFFPGMYFGNVSGFTDTKYEGYWQGTMEDVLEKLCAASGIIDWRSIIHVQHGEYISIRAGRK